MKRKIIKVIENSLISYHQDKSNNKEVFIDLIRLYKSMLIGKKIKIGRVFLENTDKKYKYTRTYDSINKLWQLYIRVQVEFDSNLEEKTIINIVNEAIKPPSKRKNYKFSKLFFNNNDRKTVFKNTLYIPFMFYIAVYGKDIDLEVVEGLNLVRDGKIIGLINHNKNIKDELKLLMRLNQ
jgi:hypothetical protein